MTANAFRVHQCIASKFIILTCNTINKRHGSAYLYMWHNENEMIQKVN